MPLPNWYFQLQEAYSNIPLDNRVSYLLSSLQNVTLDEDARQMSAVLLRRLFANDFLAFYKNLSEEQQAQFKNHILNAISVEQTVLMRRKVCDMASEVARNLIDEEGNNKWPEFLQVSGVFVFSNLCRSDSCSHKFPSCFSVICIFYFLQIIYRLRWWC